jgi:hypothetical protein
VLDEHVSDRVRDLVSILALVLDLEIVRADLAEARDDTVDPPLGVPAMIGLDGLETVRLLGPEARSEHAEPRGRRRDVGLTLSREARA